MELNELTADDGLDHAVSLTEDSLDPAGGFQHWGVRPDVAHRHGGAKFSLKSAFMMPSMGPMTQGKAMAGGAALAGGLMYLHCKAKCPGGAGTGKGLMGAVGGMGKQMFNEIGGAVKGVASGIGGLFGGGDDDKPYGQGDDGQYVPTIELVTSIHKRTCACNCKLDALLAAAAGAAAGKMIGSKMGLPSAGPLDEWTTAPFYATTISKDGKDLLVFKEGTESRPGEESRSRDVFREINHEFYSEFLCLEDDSMSPMDPIDDSQHSPSSNPQEGEVDEDRDRRSLSDRQSPETSERWIKFFQTEPNVVLDEATEGLDA